MLIGATSPVVWYTTRATGTVALVLMSATVVLGLLTASRAGSVAFPRATVATLHRSISLTAMVFLALHIVTAVADTYVAVGWTAAVVPFTSGYRPLWIGLGTVAFDLLLAVLVTSLLRARLPVGAWRAVHWVVYLAWPVAVAHAVGTGTDVGFAWMDVVVGLCVGSVLAALAWRVWAHPRRGGLSTSLPRRQRARLEAAPVRVASYRAPQGRAPGMR